MADTQTLNTDAVAAYLAERLPGFEGPIEAVKFDIGQSNPTFLLKTPGRNYVLRRKPPGVLLKSAHAVDREFRVQSALAGSKVPVAKMYLLCEDDDVIGSSFYVMEHVDGRNLRLPTLDELPKEDRGKVIDDMNRVLAELHMVDVDAVGLSDYGPPGNYFERQVGRWSKQYRASETETVPAMDTLMEELVTRMPPDDGQRTLVHGDYRIDNMIFAKDGTNCLAVLDWELSTIGHPYADLASVIMQWQMPQGPEGRGLAGVDRVAQGRPGWLAGAAPSVLDYYLATCLRWCAVYPRGHTDWFDLRRYPALHGMALALEARAATRAAIAAEGLGETPFTAPDLPDPPEGSAT